LVKLEREANVSPSGLRRIAIVHLRMSPIVLYAPNVHTGGGFVLLRALLLALPKNQSLVAFLDARARDLIPLNNSCAVSWVSPSPSARLGAEFALRNAARSARFVLCFHGLPPLMPTLAPVFVFLQNRLYVDRGDLSQFAWKTRLRLIYERFVGRTFNHRVRQYLVQTPAMERAVIQWCAACAISPTPPVKVFPFVDALPEPSVRLDRSTKWDFVYVGDGEAHKNHRGLLAAWRLLAQQGIRPSLALTLSPRDKALIREVETAHEQSGVHICNLGKIPRDEIMALYASARALIFPSTSESFGLPLVEAAHFGLPILASELDFVRDVCTPTHTFDPASPVSIARAVRRFLGCPELPVALHTAAEFWNEILDEYHS
jgi:glycosyltransferase involved in cell wall biosynthesis